MKEWKLEKYLDGHYTLDYPSETMEDTVIICKVEPYCSFEQDKHIKPLIENAPKLYEAGKLIEESFLEKCRDTIRTGTVEDLHKSITINADAFEKLMYVLYEIEGDKDS